MTITTEATYEEGVLKVREPLPLQEHARVQITIVPASDGDDPLIGVIGIGTGPTNGDAADRHDDYIYGTPNP